MRNGLFNFYIEPMIGCENDTQGIFVEIYYNNKFHSLDADVCNLLNVTLDTYYNRLKNVFKDSIRIGDQIYYDTIKSDKLKHLKTDKLFNDRYFNDLREKFKEVFCEELILLSF